MWMGICAIGGALQPPAPPQAAPGSILGATEFLAAVRALARVRVRPRARAHPLVIKQLIVPGSSLALGDGNVLAR